MSVGQVPGTDWVPNDQWWEEENNWAVFDTLSFRKEIGFPTDPKSPLWEI
jgi:hypothetical protein